MVGGCPQCHVLTMPRLAAEILYILFVMTLFAVTVGSLILGYTRSRKVDKRSDPYHVYIKNRVSMI